MKGRKKYIDKTAEIENGAKIGKNPRIYQNCKIFKGAEIGDNCLIGHNCFIYPKARIGKGVKLEGNTDIWDLVTLEDYVFVGPSVVFTNDLNPRAKYPKIKYPQYGKWLPTLVKEGASVGANATIICGNIIGKWVMIGAGAVVTKDIPDYAISVGVPAKIVGFACECGNKLHFISLTLFLTFLYFLWQILQIAFSLSSEALAKEGFLNSILFPHSQAQPIIFAGTPTTIA